MTVVWTTIATLFLLIPGFAFIAGVNITDKNIREIVFRGTPAETAYVVVVSLIVHTAFLAAPWGPRMLIDLYSDAAHLTVAADGWQPPAHWVSFLALCSLGYIVVSGSVGGGLGWALGKMVAKRRWPIFVKHRWMISLLGAGQGAAVYGRALTTTKATTGKESGDFALLVEGYIRDCYFAADGTLLYLVFADFNQRLIKLDDAGFSGTAGEIPAATGVPNGGLLVLEGSNIAYAQYDRIEQSGVGSDADLDKIVRFIEAMRKNP